MPMVFKINNVFLYPVCDGCTVSDFGVLNLFYGVVSKLLKMMYCMFCFILSVLCVFNVFVMNNDNEQAYPCTSVYVTF